MLKNNIPLDYNMYNRIYLMYSRLFLIITNLNYLLSLCSNRAVVVYRKQLSKQPKLIMPIYYYRSVAIMNTDF